MLGQKRITRGVREREGASLTAALLVILISWASTSPAGQRELAAQYGVPLKTEVHISVKVFRPGEGEIVDLVSPDLRYIAHWAFSGLPSTNVEIIRLGHRARTRADLARPYAIKGNRWIVTPTSNPSEVCWLSGRPHSFLFASCGVYDFPRVGMWRGGGKIVELAGNMENDKGSEGYNLDKVSSNGNVIYYSHDEPGSGDREDVTKTTSYRLDLRSRRRVHLRVRVHKE